MTGTGMQACRKGVWVLSAGDSACTIPPQTIAPECLEVIRDWTPKLAKALKVVGLINIQYCIQDNQVRARICATPCLPLPLQSSFHSVAGH